VTAAVPTRPGDDNPLPFAITLASAAGLAIRMLSLVSSENLAEADSAREVRQLQVAAAEENLVVAWRALPDAPEIESLVADGMTLESALKKLRWDDGHLLVVGSSRFAAPRRIFLGSKAARILVERRRPGDRHPEVRTASWPPRSWGTQKQPTRRHGWDFCDCSRKSSASRRSFGASPFRRRR